MPATLYRQSLRTTISTKQSKITSARATWIAMAGGFVQSIIGAMDQFDNA
jgi:hypothetical protein